MGTSGDRYIMFLFLELSDGMELIWWPIILCLLWSWEIAVLMHLISTGEGWRKVKQSLLKLKSSLARLQSFHQRQETDGHSCRRSCNFSGKTTQACAASRDTKRALLFCTGPQLCASGWMVPQPLQLKEMPFWEGTCLAFLAALYTCLFPRFAHCSRRKVHQRLFRFLSLTSLGVLQALS